MRNNLTIYSIPLCCFFFFFNDTATTEIYTLSLHDALPICPWRGGWRVGQRPLSPSSMMSSIGGSPRQRYSLIDDGDKRSEEHTPEIQSQSKIAWRLLL